MSAGDVKVDGSMNELLGPESTLALALFELDPGSTLAVSYWSDSQRHTGATLVMGSPEWREFVIGASSGQMWCATGKTCTPPDDARIWVTLDGVAAMQAAAYLAAP